MEHLGLAATPLATCVDVENAQSRLSRSQLADHVGNAIVDGKDQPVPWTAETSIVVFQFAPTKGTNQQLTQLGVELVTGLAIIWLLHGPHQPVLPREPIVAMPSVPHRAGRSPSIHPHSPSRLPRGTGANRAGRTEYPQHQ